MFEARRASRLLIVGGHGDGPVRELLGQLPEHPGLAVLTVVPEAPNLAELLRAETRLPVVEAAHDTRVEDDRIYVLPADQDAVLHDGRLALSPVATPGAELDRLFRSAAEAYGREAIGVILRGVGTDGAIGIKRIKEAGGLAFAEPAVEGPLGERPRAAAATGVLDHVGPPVSIVDALARLEAEVVVTPADEEDRGGQAVDTLRDILTLVRIRSGHDFGAYKRATLFRRVARRMQVCQASSITAYHQYLREHPAELSHLLRDFLISVTNFFRDTDSYQALADQVLPRLFQERSAGDQVRAWVAGCATGEEAYSLGMLLLEAAGRHRNPPQLQIFATDIDEDALTEARAGRYPETIAVDVSAERLERFFVREAGHYRVSQELRELVLFSPHNLLRDPPFSRLDLVSCRNLLIYLNREAQNRVLSMFHFGLRPNGYLFLGSSESAESSSMYAAIDAKHRIFGRRMVATGIGVETIVTAARWQPPAPAPAASAPVERSGSFGEIHHRLVERYAPPSILVNGDLDVVHLSESAGKYLELAGGEPTRHVLRLIHPALRLDLRTAIYAARQAELGSDQRRVVFDDDGHRRSVELRVRTLDVPELGPQAVLVYLDESEGSAESSAPPRETGALIEPVVREIEDELHRTRDQLRTTIEQYETSLEELKASNEELQAINEELRSASEELETSKEELQSVNEELTTLNHELKVKIDEVSHANSDLQNLMTSTDIGVVFLDRSLNIKRFTPRAVDLFNLIPSDIGRPLAHLTHKLDTDELPDLALRVLQHLRIIEKDVASRDGHRYLARLLPYRSLEDRIDGIVMTFIDVSDLRAAVDARLRSEAALRDADRRKDEFLAMLAHELRNPLTPLKVAVDVARTAKDDPDKIERAHEIMERQVELMSRLVDELRDLSRIAQGKLELSLAPLDPVGVIDAAVEIVQPLVGELGHHLEVERPQTKLVLRADRDRLVQVIANLLTNAAKYTPKGGTITLSAVPDHDRHVLVIRVSDDGIGIPADVLPRVFDLFVQEPDTGVRSRGGLGIGLSLVKRLVELHDGTVTAASEGRNRGTTITVELPLS